MQSREARWAAGARSAQAVFLVGFMGAGKTSVGRVLGQRLNWLFEDLDDRVEREQGRSIAEIFREFGESQFRRAERAALQRVLGELRSGIAKIVALGGGAFVNEGNAALLESSGVPVVFLDAPLEELWRRCREETGSVSRERPLLRNFEQFRALYRTRRKGYLRAPVKMETSGRPVEAIAAAIVKRLGLKKTQVRTESGEVE